MNIRLIISAGLTFVMSVIALIVFPHDHSILAGIGIAGGIIAMVFIFYSLLGNLFARKNLLDHSERVFHGEMRLAASLPQASMIVNEQRRIIHINPEASNLFPNIKAGSKIDRVMDRRNLGDSVSAALSGAPAEPFIYQISEPAERFFSVTASALKPMPGGESPRQAVIIFYDVTEIERANAMRADFLANASHELKTPVASLLGYIETLGGHAKDDPEARGRFLGIMKKQAERMQRLISDILSLRRIELSEHIVPTETADLYLAYLAAKQSIEPMAEARGIKIKYKGSNELLVQGQQDELVQLILNIIDNAVKMNPENEKIIVTGEKIQDWRDNLAFPVTAISRKAVRRNIVEPPESNDGYAKISIRDYGPGFRAEHLPRLSERFYRIAGDRSSAEKGTGLGLAIVKHIIVRHRGGLLVDTAEDVGTKFEILIPAATTSHDDLTS
ncbi:MAG: histidine kinase [Hellea sp.]|nr:histidine kinase [Hellea sp.]